MSNMTAPTVTIKNGTYGKKEVRNKEFVLVKPYDAVKGHITVWGSKDQGLNVSEPRSCRIKVAGTNAFKYNGDVPVNIPTITASNAPVLKDPIAEFLAQESEKDALKRIGTTFTHLEKFTQASIEGIVRGLIVVGPPGIGKSYGVERVLGESAMMAALGGSEQGYEVIKGTISPGFLYRKLFEYKGADRCLYLMTATSKMKSR